MNASPLRGNNGATPIVAAPIVLAAPTPADKPATTTTPPTASGFAELLRRSRVEAPTPVPAAPVTAPSPQSEAADGTGPQDPSAIESKAALANAAKARAATPKSATGKAVVENTEQKSENVRSEVDDDSADGIEPAASTASPFDRVDARSAAAIAFDSPRQSARSSRAEIDDAIGSGAGDRDASTGTGDATRRSAGHARGMANVDAANERRASAAEASRDSALRAGAEASFQAALAEVGQPLDSAPAAPAHDRAVDALTASFAIGAATRSAEPVAGTPATISLALPTPIDAPDFAASLGVQVSVLAKDGVQQAELHLNPAEMGPVSIHISLDGTAARVDFGADVAATRAIERGLPELASALRDAGFTLAGGGVSQHAGGRSAGEDDAARAARRIDAGGTVASTPIAAQPGRVIRRIAAGGVDLYA